MMPPTSWPSGRRRKVKSSLRHVLVAVEGEVEDRRVELAGGPGIRGDQVVADQRARLVDHLARRCAPGPRHSPNWAPTGSRTIAIRPWSSTSIGSTSRVPPASRARSAVRSQSVGRQVDVPEAPGVGLVHRRDRGDATAPQQAHRVPAGLLGADGELPAEHRAVEGQRAVEVGHAQVDPGRRPERLVGVDVHGDSSPRRPHRSAGHRHRGSQRGANAAAQRLRGGGGETRRRPPRRGRRPRSRRCPAPTQATTVASPARRWKNDCRTRQPTTARRCSTACSRTSQPLRTAKDRAPAAWPSDAYRPRPTGTPRTVRAIARGEHPPPARAWPWPRARRR